MPLRSCCFVVSLLLFFPLFLAVSASSESVTYIDTDVTGPHDGTSRMGTCNDDTTFGGESWAPEAVPPLPAPTSARLVI